jgi:hypothetical protein
MGRIALCGLLLLSVSGCLGLGSAPPNDVVLSTNAPVVDESLPGRQTGHGTNPQTQLAQSLATSARWRRSRPVDFGELDRPTGAPMPAAITPGKPAATGVDMRAAAPAPRAAHDPAHDSNVDSVTSIDRLMSRAKTAARTICDRC